MKTNSEFKFPYFLAWISHDAVIVKDSKAR